MKAMDYTSCPACNHKGQEETEVVTVSRCTRCGAIYGTCYKGEAYGLVKPYMTTEDVPDERLRYFDFTMLGSDGVTRRHGWYDIKTRLVVQTG